MIILMSIKILLISSDDSFFQKIEIAYQAYIEKGFFKIYSPKDVENSNNKIYYDVILTDEEYVSLRRAVWNSPSPSSRVD